MPESSPRPTYGKLSDFAEEVEGFLQRWQDIADRESIAPGFEDFRVELSNLADTCSAIAERGEWNRPMSPSYQDLLLSAALDFTNYQRQSPMVIRGTECNLSEDGVQSIQLFSLSSDSSVQSRLERNLQDILSHAVSICEMAGVTFASGFPSSITIMPRGRGR